MSKRHRRKRKDERNAPCSCGSGKKHKNCCASGRRPVAGARPTTSSSVASPVRLAAVLAAAVLAVIVYAGVFDAPFLYDDNTYVKDNRLIASLGNLPRAFTSSYPPDLSEAGLYRPLTTISFMLDHAVGGLDPHLFHISNALLHALATALFVLILQRTVASGTVALAAGLLFAAHPVHTEAVAWIVGRAEVLAGVFTFAAVLLWISFRRTGKVRFLSGTAACYFLALCAKETAAPLPAVLLAWEYLGAGLGQPADGDAATPAGGGRRSWPAAGYVLFSLLGVFSVYAVLRIAALGQFTGVRAGAILASEPFATRMATAVAAIGKYVWLLAWPFGQRVDYSDFVFHSWGGARVLWGLVAIAALVAGIVLTRRRLPAAAGWLVWFALFILPFSNLILPIGAVLAERFVYITSASICAVTGMAVGTAMCSPRGLVRYGTAGAALLLISVFAYATVARNRDWSDEERFWRTAAAQSPQSEKILVNLGAQLCSKWKTTADDAYAEEAEEVLRRVRALRPPDSSSFSRDHVYGLYNLARLLEQRRSEESKELFGEIVELYRRHPRLETEIAPEVYVFHGNALRAERRSGEALEAYERALELRPDWPAALLNAGSVLATRGDHEAAVSRYRKAIRIDPDFWGTHYQLAISLMELQRADEARAVVAGFPAGKDGSGEAEFRQGQLYDRLGDHSRARECHARALQINPTHAGASASLKPTGT
jgi:tetratricopeptide (TPR) repeat protein